MTRPEAEQALAGLLGGMLGDFGNSVPEALQRLNKVYPPVLTLRCRDHRDLLGQIYARGRERLFVGYVRRDVTWLAGELGRVATFVFWLDQVRVIQGIRCQACPRNVRVDVADVLVALRAGQTEMLC